MSYSSDRIRINNQSDGVSLITLDKPEKRNALDPLAILTLTDALRECDDDVTTRVIVITGAEGAFCAGGDIASFGTMTDSRIRRRGARLVDTLLSLEKPVIARVNGVAIGLGLSIALLADFTVASNDSTFGDTHVTLGAVAGDGAALILPLLAGLQRAKELLMTGRIIGAEEAAQIGMILRSVSRKELDAEVSLLAQRLAAQPSYAVRGTKVAINSMLKTASHEVLDLALAYEEISRSLPEHEEAVAAWRTSGKISKQRATDFPDLNDAVRGE